MALALTLFSLILVLLAYAQTGLGKTGRLPSAFGAYAMLMTGGFLGGHLLIRRFAPRSDPVLFPLCSALAGIGFAVIFGIDGGLATEQAVWLAVGLVAFALTLTVVRDHRMLQAFTYTIGLVGVALLLLPVLPGIGRAVNGERLWIGLGPIQFQPSEIGKVLVVIFLASYLDRNRELLRTATRKIGPVHIPRARYLGPLVMAWVVSLALLVLEKDLGASLLYFGIFTLMLWISTSRAMFLLVAGVLFFSGASVAYRTFPTAQERVQVWFHALDPSIVNGNGYQLAQGEFAMASGGVSGVGLGKGQAQLIPAAATDFIFAEMGEELGLLGTAAILLMYVVIVGRGLRIAVVSRDDFGKLLATGLASLLAIQVFVIVGGVTRLIPLTGITLPFVSYGGSSLVSNFVILALLVRISSGPVPSHSERPRTREERAR